MENNNYFAEMMKSPMPREKVKTATDEFIDNLLNEVIFKQEKKKLMAAIDHSLDKGDRTAFLKLSSDLNELEKKYNS
ncbi:uncharacterized protein YpiB (UPF0302 family) [Bacillus ectoiniformans]|uniref:IDEAL domain-containing protein n=1 Tax=Bacillus ectoiniformans TaxID=1494429 RepID=UPI001959CC4E|nr:IDEAL domain-containing protein [Bacillus ectoiniformans]MBM7647587.1 uncharacterized protein YpiB (UPF0302 family) [Bacillus ectoiniformans]